MKLLTCSILLMSLTLVGCRPDQEETSYNQMDLVQLNGDGSEQGCALIDNLDSCLAAPVCQPVFQEGGTSDIDFISCTEYPEEDPVDESADSSSGEDMGDDGVGAGDDMGDDGMGSGSSDDSMDSDSGSSSSSDDDSSEDLADYSCGNNEKKVLVCHIPPGNEANAHTICIAENAWINGHKDRHQGNVDNSVDYLGPCKRSDIESDDE